MQSTSSGFAPGTGPSHSQQIPQEFPYLLPGMPYTASYRNYSEYKVKLRKFKPGFNVRTWFEIAESEFNERRTSEVDRFTALVSSLDDEVYDSMSNAIAGLPPINRYESLKTLLIEYYSLTRGQEIRKLLSGLLIKDKKPFRLLAEMRSLAGPGRFDNEDSFPRIPAQRCSYDTPSGTRRH